MDIVFLTGGQSDIFVCEKKLSDLSLRYFYEVWVNSIRIHLEIFRSDS